MTGDSLRILYLEDDEDDIVLIRSVLDQIYGSRYQLDWAPTIKEALDLLKDSVHDLVVVDYRLGGETGVDFVRQAVALGRTDTPIVLLTTVDDRDVDVEAMEAGATDYLVKGQLTAGGLERCIRYAVKQKSAEASARHRAYHDPLTNLPNRALLLDRIERTIARAKRRGVCGAVLFIDLDGFKAINDTYGHVVGDEVLKTVASRLLGTTRGEDTVARLGGDEFVVLLPELTKEWDKAGHQAIFVATKVRDALGARMTSTGHNLVVTPSIGVVLVTGDAASATELLDRADQAMYGAKAAGRNTIEFLSADGDSTLCGDRETYEALRTAADSGALEMVLQPQVEIEDHHVSGAEALVRWHHPSRGELTAREFIPMAEDSGLILPIGSWILNSACQQIADWDTLPFIGVNISAAQFRQPDFVEMVEQALGETKAEPSRLMLEIKETTLLEDLDASVAKARALQALGVGVSMDNFGKGLMSIGCLSCVPVDMVKLDRSLIRAVSEGPAGASVLSIVLSACRNLGIAVVAHGVETEDEFRVLKGYGMKTFQGYLFSPPLPVRAFSQVLSKSVAGDMDESSVESASAGSPG